jgi:hypothetical protein
MTTSDTLSMSPLATYVREALVQQKQLQIVLSQLRLAFTFFQKLYKTFSSELCPHTPYTARCNETEQVYSKWVGLPVASSLGQHVSASLVNSV